MTEWLVIPKRPDGSLAWNTAQVVWATTPDEAAASAYRRCVVIACHSYSDE